MKIQINNLKKTFGPKVAVNIDEFHIQDGEILGLVGNNGAGKSTLFRLMLDLIKADTGRVRMQCGDADVDVSETEEWKDWTGAYIDEGFLIDYLTPDEYFQFIANISNMSEKDCEDKLDTFETFLDGLALGQ
ncbi:MAG: ATP-binding cassette domain-containing protein [Paraprevotella sp.]|nr:ATP-binding cassette domain-containing protein [Paraprevotella sp.]